MRQLHKVCGTPYLRFIVNVQSLTPISGQLMQRFYRARGRSAIGKQTGKTSYIERFNNKLRQRVSRLVRKTLSFSKSLENHIGAIGLPLHIFVGVACATLREAASRLMRLQIRRVCVSDS